MEFEVQQLSLNNKRLTQEADDAKMQLENELLIKTTLENKFKNLQLDFDNVTAQYEEEQEAKLELHKQLIKLQDEYKQNKDRNDKETEVRIEEIEDSKLVFLYIQ